jgi:glycosyltransferase involved in cell wall biosynthesis
VLTTDVPGCRYFVRDGRDGVVVPPNDATALAKALIVFSSSPALAERMGASARTRLLDGFTERDVMNGVKALYRGLLAAPAADVAA